MKAVELKKDIFWVGAVDWDARDFHGYAVSPYGTTYNAFLIRDEKTALFDTVKSTHKGEFFCNVAHVAKPEEIDYFVINHLEPDHSGALAEAVERYQPEKIICSQMGKRSMEAHYRQAKDWPLHVVKSGDQVSLGKRTLTFLETRMLHWPDNMATYIPEEKLLISSDAFGQNWATSQRFADEVDRTMLERRMSEYFANIVLPYSPIVLKVLKQVEEMGLDIEMIFPDHGLLWRGEDVSWVIESYRKYATQKPSMKAVVVYDTMWHSTEKMAEAVADGLVEEGLAVRVMSVKSNHHTHIMTEILDAGVVAVGSPTHNNGILPYVASTLTYMKGLRPQNKIGGAFGSFGWSGECVKVLSQWLSDMNFEVVDPGPKANYVPTHEALGECVEYGRKLGRALKEKLGS